MTSKITIAIVGVHGVGKTATAQVLAKRGYYYQQLEVIDEAYGLNPLERQLLFFLSYTREYLKATTHVKSYTVFDSHPLLVVPYTEYWLKQQDYADIEIRKLTKMMIDTILFLPKTTLLVYLRPRSLETVVKRLKLRRRFNLDEEAKLDYIEFIDRRTRFYVELLGKRIAREVLVVEAEKEAYERADIIHRALLKHVIALL